MVVLPQPVHWEPSHVVQFAGQPSCRLHSQSPPVQVGGVVQPGLHSQRPS